MCDLIILLVHLIATLARLMGPGGARSVIAESLLASKSCSSFQVARSNALTTKARAS